MADLEGALQDAERERVAGVAREPQPEVLVRVDELLEDLLERLEPRRQQVAVLQHHPLPARRARVDVRRRERALALAQRADLEARPAKALLLGELRQGAVYFRQIFRRMPTANAEGSMESEGSVGRGLGEMRRSGAFRSARVLGVRRRQAPKCCQKKNELRQVVGRVRAWRQDEHDGRRRRRLRVDRGVLQHRRRHVLLRHGLGHVVLPTAERRHD